MGCHHVQPNASTAPVSTTNFDDAQDNYVKNDIKMAGHMDEVGQDGRPQDVGADSKDVSSMVVGDIVTFGHYEQDNDTTNGKEPIAWRVLDKNDEGQYLIISEKVLDVQPYNTTNLFITFEKSTIRSWLNGYTHSYNKVGIDITNDNFIDTAFTAEEKAKLVTSNAPAHVNTSHSSEPGNATTDKVFLLSMDEAHDYFTSDEDRLADATRYAVKKAHAWEAQNQVSMSTDSSIIFQKVM